MRAVLADTLGPRISGSGRSFSETLARDFDFDRVALLAGARVLVGLWLDVLWLEPFREEDRVDSPVPFLPVADDLLERVDFDFSDVDDLAALLDVDLAAVDLLSDVFALRRRRRCVLVIASTRSSFRIPCQPAIP